MRAVIYTRTGGPEVLHVVDRAPREPGPGEVTVRIHRSGVNPTDWKSRQGGSEPADVDPAQVPNQDGAGVVESVGAGVDTALVGSRVWVWEAAYRRPDGTAQEVAVIPVDQVVVLPEGVSFDLGASLGIPFLTAHRCLTVAEQGPHRLAPGALHGRTVLVSGGAGAVGNAAIQLARWSGATVITTVSGPAKAQLATAAGADHVVNYRDQDVVTEVRRLAPTGVDAIVEVSPSVNAALDAAVIGRHGSIAMYADDGGGEITVPIRSQMGPNARWQFVLVYTEPASAKAVAVQDVTAALAAGAIHEVLPLHHYSLERAGEAHAAVQASITGKVLIDVTD
jgi:NADPH2:quinone reductase